MSGGSLDYAYSRVEQAADDILKKARTPLHRAFAAHLTKVSKALYDLEWMLSGDTAEGSEIESILAVVSKTEEIESATDRAIQALKELREVLDSVKP